MDLTSLRAVAKLRLKMNSSYVDLAIADAFRRVRNEQFWFNTSSFTFATVDDVGDYPLPSDFLSLIGNAYYTPNGTDDTGRYPLVQVTLEELEEYKYKQDWDGEEIVGNARRCALDYSGRRLYLAPTPSDDGDKVFFRYLKDLGTPTYTVSATASAPPSLSPTVTMLGPDGQTLPSDFTNDWFKHGFAMLAHLTVHILWKDYHGGSEEATIKANESLSSYLEELSRLRGETSMKIDGARIRPHFP